MKFILFQNLNRLHKTQDLLYESTKDFLELRYQGRSNERQWMGEKDKLLRDLDHVKLQLHPNRDPVLNMSDGALDRAGCVEEMKVRHSNTAIKPTFIICDCYVLILFSDKNTLIVLHLAADFVCHLIQKCTKSNLH